MPFELATTRRFSASHRLRMPDGSLEPLHGHNWTVRVTVAAEELQPIGWVMDFHDLERRVDRLIEPMHNSHLNDHPNLANPNPSAEIVAQRIGDSLDLPAGIRLISVEVWETEENSAIYRP